MSGFQWCQPRTEGYVTEEGQYLVGEGSTLDEVEESGAWVATTEPVEVRE